MAAISEFMFISCIILLVGFFVTYLFYMRDATEKNGLHLNKILIELELINSYIDINCGIIPKRAFPKSEPIPEKKPEPIIKSKLKRAGAKPISKDSIKKIQVLYDNSCRKIDIAKNLGISYSTVCRYITAYKTTK